MPGAVCRNAIVQFFGQPDLTEGSVNDPRERNEHGMQFNERWTYRHPLRDPAGAVERIIYWHRYDYVGSVIQRQTDGPWEKDETLPGVLAAGGE
ncbi:MAG: hypothetical protein ACE5I7_10615 [Candidatus Binatia bacterium]